jgi:hypothetical protein
MGSLIRLAVGLVIESGIAGGVRSATRRLAAAAICAGLAALLIVAALGCLATALWMSVLPSLGPVGAPLVVAAVLLASALALALAIWLIMRHGRRHSGAGRVVELLLAEATDLIKEHKAAVLLAAVLAGVAAATGGRKS